jgi:hypothetical protein
MSHSSQRRRAAEQDHFRRSGALMLGASALVLAAVVVAPWLASRLTRWPLAPVVVVALALPPAVYFWFRRVQRTRPRTATLAAVGYGVLAAGVLWLWSFV